ncbi:MAG: hypothetical protein Q7U04_08230, partial [Bacteriovorax sp.]|nr:hypothetical protein [Bacteriovorax sp.]
FDFIYSYVYSKRNKTRAANFEDSLSDDVRGARLREIQAYQLDIQNKIHQTIIGKTFRVLVDSEGNMGGVKKWKGRTNCNRIVHFIPENIETDFKWHWVDVKILSATALSCQGELVTDLGKKAPSLFQ